MSSINEQLYDYLIENSPYITQQWLEEKRNFTDPFYSNNSNPLQDELLREQNALTIRTVATAFWNENSFSDLLKTWAETVAKNRVENDIAIHHVIEALNKTREIIWSYVERFVHAKEKEISNANIIKWSTTYNQSFDRLIFEFSKRYYYLFTTRFNAQQTLIRELSSPIIPILEKVGVLPIVGDVDTYRAKALTDEIPQKCIELGLDKLFIDISGVSIIDTMVANELYKFMEVLSLLGIRPYISGIRPEVAHTSVQLGLDFGKISTFSSLKQALLRTGVYKNM
ncbi:STAS domain-containing protein [Psychrobacillus sp. FSL W7-1457]|uniref:STAS domain-containing protein n=1 Tax=unclassified Psychrobacillus TaxID=2636677 RepID=UPI0030FB0902